MPAGFNYSCYCLYCQLTAKTGIFGDKKSAYRDTLLSGCPGGSKSFYRRCGVRGRRIGGGRGRLKDGEMGGSYFSVFAVAEVNRGHRRCYFHDLTDAPFQCASMTYNVTGFDYHCFCLF